MGRDSLTDADRGVLAGLIMGEGCLTLVNRSTPRLEIKMCDRPVIEWLLATFGGTINQPSLSPLGRWNWRWRIAAQPCLDLLADIGPLLLAPKREQAELLAEAVRYPRRSATRLAIARQLSQLKRINYVPDPTD